MSTAIWAWADAKEEEDAKRYLPVMLFSASEVMRQVAYRRAIRAGFYNDEIPAATVVRGLQNMLAARRRAS